MDPNIGTLPAKMLWLADMGFSHAVFACTLNCIHNIGQVIISINFVYWQLLLCQGSFRLSLLFTVQISPSFVQSLCIIYSYNPLASVSII